MSNYKFTLQPYKANKRFECPGCGMSKQFARYIDTATGEYVHDTVGRCNRSDNCGYHYKPHQYFTDNGIVSDTSTMPKLRKANVAPPKQPSYIPLEAFKQTLSIEMGICDVSDSNHFVAYLNSLFGSEISRQLVAKYFIGTSKLWSGATVFWQIDAERKIRTGKIMVYNPTTGKRIKDKNSWIHSTINQPDYVLSQCFFGEHLISKDLTKIIAIVESEKTAMIASVYLPQYIWLASSGKEGLSQNKCKALHGRKVILYPDLNGFEKWSSKAKEFASIANFTVSDLLERKATEVEKQQGLDLADYLIRCDYKAFAIPPLPAVAVQPLIEIKAISKPEKLKPENWEQDITELQNYFAEIQLPTQPIKLNQCSTIIDCSQFIDSHLAILKTNKGKPAFLPYLERLQILKNVLTTN